MFRFPDGATLAPGAWYTVAERGTDYLARLA